MSFKKRAPRAIKSIREFAVKAMVHDILLFLARPFGVRFAKSVLTGV